MHNSEHSVQLISAKDAFPIRDETKQTTQNVCALKQLCAMAGMCLMVLHNSVWSIFGLTKLVYSERATKIVITLTVTLNSI